jgi:hypothetical protein
MNVAPQASRPGGFQSVFTGPVSAPVRTSAIQHPGIQSNIRPSPHVSFSSQVQAFLPGTTPNNSVTEPAIGLDMPPDEGVIHNIKEIRMPPKPKSFKFG